MLSWLRGRFRASEAVILPFPAPALRVYDDTGYLPADRGDTVGLGVAALASVAMRDPSYAFFCAVTAGSGPPLLDGAALTEADYPLE